MTVESTAEKVLAGGRLSGEEALELYVAAPTSLLGRLADTIRVRKHPTGVVTYIIDRNVNYTNVCVARCSFCAFYRPVGADDGYVLGFDELFRKIWSARALVDCIIPHFTVFYCILLYYTVLYIVFYNVFK